MDACSAATDCSVMAAGAFQLNSRWALRWPLPHGRLQTNCSGMENHSGAERRKAPGKVDGQRVKTVLLAWVARYRSNSVIQISNWAWGHRRHAGRSSTSSRPASARVVAVGKADGGFFDIGFVHEFLQGRCGRWCRLVPAPCSMWPHGRAIQRQGGFQCGQAVAREQRLGAVLREGWVAEPGGRRGVGLGLSSSTGGRGLAAGESPAFDNRGRSSLPCHPPVCSSTTAWTSGASISSIFLIVTARSPGGEAALEERGRAARSAVRWPLSIALAQFAQLIDGGARSRCAACARSSP